MLCFADCLGALVIPFGRDAGSKVRPALKLPAYTVDVEWVVSPFVAGRLGEERSCGCEVADCTSLDLPVLSPDEEELARQKARLADLEDELADRELALATRRRELADFQTRYLGVVGVRMAELDQLEAQIAAILAARERSPEADVRAERAYEQARESAEALGDDPDALRQAAAEAPREIPEDLKKLFRKVAKAVHPDHAANDEERPLRERAMAEANAAYAAGDVDRLKAILADWENRPEAVSGDGTGAELVRVIRAIAAVEARLATVAAEFNACATGSLWRLYEDALTAEAEGRDLLQELAEELESRIVEARRRIAQLRGAQEAQ